MNSILRTLSPLTAAALYTFSSGTISQAVFAAMGRSLVICGFPTGGSQKALVSILKLGIMLSVLEMPHVYNGQLCRGNPHCELRRGNVVWNSMCTTAAVHTHTHI